MAITKTQQNKKETDMKTATTNKLTPNKNHTAALRGTRETSSDALNIKTLRQGHFLPDAATDSAAPHLGTRGQRRNKMKTLNQEQLKSIFADFVNNLSNTEIKSMRAAHRNIYFKGGEFYTSCEGRGTSCIGLSVYDSEGQADFPITIKQLKKDIIEGASMDALEMYIHSDEQVAH
jgi:hypothetical protein